MSAYSGWFCIFASLIFAVTVHITGNLLGHYNKCRCVTIIRWVAGILFYTAAISVFSYGVYVVIMARHLRFYRDLL